MKKTFSILIITMLGLTLSAQEKKVKTGWKFGGALPTITFDSDLGFQYGALVEFFNYGDGSTYPDYFDYCYYFPELYYQWVLATQSPRYHPSLLFLPSLRLARFGLAAPPSYLELNLFPFGNHPGNYL